MSQSQPPDRSHRSPSLARHRRESFWQITLPMLAVLLAAGVAFALIVLSGAAGISGVADLSLILISFPLLVAGLVVLALTVALLLGVGWLLRETPPVTRLAQDASARLADLVGRAMQQVANAVIPALVGYGMAQRLLDGRRAAREDGSETDRQSAP